MTSELRPVALMHTHDDEFTEFEEYRNGSGCLTQADKDAGWTETPLYTLEAVRAEQAAEVERLRKLIEATSAHFLRLNTDHPIMWEGAIDAAMEAVCLEVGRQAAELAKFKALAETLAGALELADCALSGANMNMRVVYRKVAEALRQYKEARDA